MKVEEAKKIADQQLERLAEALEQGRSEALRGYLAAMSKLYKYSLRNLLLIFSQRPDAHHVAGFNTWKSLGRHVKKGEKGIVIIAPMPLKKHEGETDEDEKDDKTGMRFKAAYVFDVSQTEGEPLPELARAQGEPGQCLGSLKELLQVRQVTLRYAENLDGAEGVSQGGTIILRAGLAPAEEFSVLVHELAHELLHQGKERAVRSKVVRETEAEAVSFVVSEAIGLNAAPAAADYIQLYQGNADMLRASLEAIQNAASVILSGIMPVG